MGGLVRAIVTAGDQEIQSQCKEYIQDKGDLLEGQTMITSAGALPCDKVIHTVGPRWISWESQEKCSLMEQRLHFFRKSELKLLYKQTGFSSYIPWFVTFLLQQPAVTKKSQTGNR